MITLLGKRPFVGRSDDMDKWLDENPSPRGTHERSAPPPLEEPEPEPAVASTAIQDRLL
jgi:AFG3 family protein